jgi:hypothetical protein
MPQVSPKDSVGFPEWSKDSQSIYFLDQNTVGGTGVYRVPIKGGAPILIAAIKDFNISGWWNSWMGLDDADAPLVVKDVGSDNVYALTMEEK